LPAAEVVVDVNRWNAGAGRSSFQLGDLPADWKSEAQKFFALFEVEIVNDVNQKQSCA
jgi:hypothetical protein